MTPKRRKALLDELIKIAVDRGVRPEDLHPHVLKIYTKDIPAGPWREQREELADEVTSAGLAAQLSFLAEALGETRFRRMLATELGSILDGFVLGFSSTPDEVDRSIGRENINEHGDVI